MQEPSTSAEARQALLHLVQQLVAELHPHRAVSVALDTRLEQDLGLDSLGRAELLVRLERAFGVPLPEQLLASAETPRDLLRAVQAARPATPSPALAAPAAPHQATTLAPPSQVATLVEALRWHAQHQPQQRHVYLYGDDDAAQDITYGALYAEALSAAACLQAQGVEPGQTVALMLPTCRAFLAGFFGILLAGAIPVPIYPPARPSQLEAHLRRQAGILRNARAVALLTVAAAKPLARLLRALVPTLRRVLTEAELAGDVRTYTPVAVQPQDVAFVQYTSGSTGDPKGVVLTHTNVLVNLRAMNEVARTTPQDVFVSWLPLYHDMGLIGAWLGSLYYGYPLVLLSPLAFLARPQRWLWAIHRHRGTISGGPNFAYELCLRKLEDRDLEGLDLRSWRIAFNGAEAISPQTLERFCERFARYGFRREAMTPVYGLAENTLGLAFPPPGRGPRYDRIQGEVFRRSGRAVPADAGEPHALCFVSCGFPLPGHEIRIVDAAGFEVGERQQGRLEFRGPSATSGYLHNPEATRRLFRGDWLDSGDLAYLADGEVYITGRAKDVIIRAGRNLYPQELEEAVGNLPGIRKGCVAVFGSSDAATGTERLVVVAETHATAPQARSALRRQIEALTLELLGLPADEVVLVPPQTVLKTSSGKLRRAACRELYERGQLGKGPRAPKWQLLRLALAALGPQLGRLRRLGTTLLYAAAAWSLFGLLAPWAWAAAVLLPRPAWRHAAVRRLIRFALRLAGLPLVVEGRERLPAGPCVLVANHASYLDAFVLLAVLPGTPSFVAKRELARHWLTRLPLAGLGVEFVERFDAPQGVADTSRLLKTARQGRTLVVFPEGTFSRQAGLRPFHLGAFVVAAQAGLPVVPVALRGTRSVLRGEQWLLRRGPLRVTVGAPLKPQGTDWAAALALRAAARAYIAQHCGEPDLASAGL